MIEQFKSFIAEGGEERPFFLEPKRQGAAINGWLAVGLPAPHFAIFLPDRSRELLYFEPSAPRKI